MATSVSISRRTVLKGLGVAAGSASLGVVPSPPAEGLLLRPSGRCYVYLDHAARNRASAVASTGAIPAPAGPGAQWVVGALLVLDPRLPRQILRRAKRHRLSSEERTIPEISARAASSEFKQYFYKRLGAPLKKLKKAPLIELYSIRASQSVLSVPRERVGLFQLRMVQALLEGCDLWRFREVFVYHNLPSLRYVSEKAFHAGLAQGVRLRRGTNLDVWEHAAVWTRQVGLAEDHLVDEGIQVADFATHAFYQKYQHGNARWYNLIRPRIRREINALSLLPAFVILR